MRFLVVNHLRLGCMPGEIPDHTGVDRSMHSMRSAWFRAVDLAIREQVHALFLTGETIAQTNSGLEPFGPCIDGLAQVQKGEIAVVAVPTGNLTPAVATRYNLGDAIQFLDEHLDWHPPISSSREPVEGPSIHILPASLTESGDAPVAHPITIEEIDHPDSIWLLTDPIQPDSIRGDHAIIVEPGSIAPCTMRETGRHGAWLIDTDSGNVTLIPLASLEYASIDLDVQTADSIEDVERLIAEALVAEAELSRRDGSIANTMLVSCTITGRTRLYSALADITSEFQRTLAIQHDGMAITISDIQIDATPDIDLASLVARPDPVGEVARLIDALTTGNELSETQARLMTAAEQKLLTVSHSRVFGAIVDSELTTDARTLLKRQGWATLDALVRQRGID